MQAQREGKMRNLPVCWFEGLFLRPHHFQAADRYLAESQQTSEHWDHEYNYGVRTLELSEEAIANGQVQVDVCRAYNHVRRDKTVPGIAGKEGVLAIANMHLFNSMQNWTDPWSALFNERRRRWGEPLESAPGSAPVPT